MAKRVTPELEPLRALFYGLPGSTKTRTVSTAAWDERTAPCLMLEAGANPSAIRDYDPAPDIIRMEELEDFNDPYEWIKNGQPEADKLVKVFKLNPPYKTVIIDQLTDVQQMYFELVLGSKNLKVAGIVRKREWSDYNKILYSMQRFVKNYYALMDYGINVIMVCQEREADRDAGRPIGPLLEGQTAVYAPSFANLVVRMRHATQLEARVRKALEKERPEAQAMGFFKQHPDYQAKDQLSNGALGDHMIDPTLPKMLDLIYGPAKPETGSVSNRK